MPILTLGDKENYCEINIYNDSKIRDYFSKVNSSSVFKDRDFWKGFLDSLKIKGTEIHASELTPFGCHHDIGIYENTKNITYFVHKFFEEAEKYILKDDKVNTKNYVSVQDLKAEGIDSIFKNPKFSGKAQVLIPNPKSLLFFRLV